MSSDAWRFTLGLALLAAVACKRPGVTTDGETDAGGVTDERPAAQDQTRESHNDYLIAVRREQLELRGRLQQDIDDIDQKLLLQKIDPANRSGKAPSSGDTKVVRALMERRERLESDLGRVNRSDERGWDELKAEVERDLEAPTTPRGPEGAM